MSTTLDRPGTNTDTDMPFDSRTTALVTTTT